MITYEEAVAERIAANADRYNQEAVAAEAAWNALAVKPEGLTKAMFVASRVSPMPPVSSVEAEMSFLKAQPAMPEEPETVAVHDAIWKVGDQYWNVAEAKYVPEPVDKSRVIELGGPATEANLRASIRLYGEKLGPEIMDTEELFVALRAKRNERLDEYDRKISQLDRLIRENPDYGAYPIQRAAWDEYATALCNLPAQEGAPWDGGGPLTPWPAQPE